MTRELKKHMLSNFLGGISWGFGTVIGATVIVTMLVWLLSFINLVPIVGDFASGVLNVINSRQPLK